MSGRHGATGRGYARPWYCQACFWKTALSEVTGDREVGEAGGQGGAPARATGKPWGPSQGGGREEVDGLPECREVDSGGRGDGLDSRDREEEAGWSPPGSWVPPRTQNWSPRGTQNSL